MHVGGGMGLGEKGERGLPRSFLFYKILTCLFTKIPKFEF